jgi:hypothetical protein
MPASGGEPKKLTPGDAVSADAGGRELIVSLRDQDAIRLQRLPVGGGYPRPIPLPSGISIPGTQLSSSMVGPGGQIVVRVASPAKWDWRIGLIDRSAGKFNVIPLNFDGETLNPTWTRDGKLVVMGSFTGFNIWRFRQAM